MDTGVLAFLPLDALKSVRKCGYKSVETNPPCFGQRARHGHVHVCREVLGQSWRRDFATWVHGTSLSYARRGTLVVVCACEAPSATFVREESLDGREERRNSAHIKDQRSKMGLFDTVCRCAVSSLATVHPLKADERFVVFEKQAQKSR